MNIITFVLLRIDEHIIKQLSMQNTACATPNHKLTLILYYKNTQIVFIPADVYHHQFPPISNVTDLYFSVSY